MERSYEFARVPVERAFSDRTTDVGPGGAVGLLGTGLADLLRLEAQAASGTPAPRGGRAGRAKSVVFFFQSGGPSQHETFDPKPDAPDSIRGDYGTIQTALPGVGFCEHLPKLAARAGRFAVVRTMHHIVERRFRTITKARNGIG